MTWTQPICDSCWERLEPDRDPVRIKEAYCDEEICAHCGFQTRSGIYRRDDPGLVPYPSAGGGSR